MAASRRRWCLALALAASVTGLGCASGSAGAARPGAFPRDRAPEPPAAAPTAPAAVVSAVLRTALALRGSPYRFGGEDPTVGFDCSGFVQYVFEQHRIELPRTVAEQFRTGRRLNRTDISPGDLVFFATTGPGPTHVGIVVDGDRFVHAPDTGAAVRLEHFGTSYWRARFTGARRVIGPSAAE